MSINSDLDARCAAALAKIIEPLNAEAAENLASDAFLWARDAGYFAAKTKTDQMPIFFQGEKVLEQGWNEGFDFAESLHEMENCPGCQNIRGEPCHIHG